MFSIDSKDLAAGGGRGGGEGKGCPMPSSNKRSTPGCIQNCQLRWCHLCKNTAQQWENEVWDTKVREEGRAGASETGAEIPLQPIEKTRVGHISTAQRMKQVDTSWKKARSMENLHWSRFLIMIAIHGKDNTQEQLIWQEMQFMGDMCWSSLFPERLQSVKGPHFRHGKDVRRKEQQRTANADCLQYQIPHLSAPFDGKEVELQLKEWS